MDNSVSWLEYGRTLSENTARRGTKAKPTSFPKKPIVGNWQILAPIIAMVCVAAGWQEAGDKSGRLRLIVTQALHWFAFLLVMNLMLLSSVQRIFTAQTGLAIFTLLALGTFTAGVHVLSWQVSRPDHGAGHSGDCLDRELGLACCVDRGCPRGRGRGPVVALASGR